MTTTVAPTTTPITPPSSVRPTATRLGTAIVLFVGAGLAIATSTSNHAIAIAAWLAPILLVRALRTTPTTRGLLVGAAVYALAFSWAWQAQWPVPPVLLAGLATIFYLPYVADRLLHRRLGPIAATFVLPAAWITVEYALVHLPILEGSPIGAWAATVHSQHGNGPLLQLLAVTGSWGITFLVAWTASVVNAILEHGLHEAWPRRLAASLVVVLLATMVLGGARLAFAAPPEETVRVAGVAIDNDEILVRTWSPVRRGTPLTDHDREVLAEELTALHDRLFELSELEVRAGARVVAWAEDNALVFRPEADALIARGRRFAADHGVALFLGMVVLEPGEPADNQVVGITPDGEVAFTYLKSFPAPGEGSRPGDGAVAWMDTPWGRIGAAICFDHDFPALIRQAGRAGVDIMINPSDDTPAIDPLHPHMAVPRAIENGFAMVRPAQGARSIAVDAYGRILAVQEADQPERHFAVDVPTSGRPTLYARIGDLPAQLAVLGLLLLVGLAVRRRWVDGDPAAPDGSPDSVRRRSAPVTLAIAMALLAGCAAAPSGSAHDDHDHPSDSPPIAGAPEVVVEAAAMSFTPSAVTLAAGEPVNLTLSAADTFHDLVVDEVDFHLGAHAGERATGGIVLERPGTYTAYCTLPGHRAAGMELTLHVR